jgi:hypothetical protein
MGQTTALSEGEEFAKIVLLPNRSNGLSNEEGASQLKKIEIFSTCGLKIHESMTSEVDVRNLAPGIYFVHIHTSKFFKRVSLSKTLPL